MYQKENSEDLKNSFHFILYKTYKLERTKKSNPENYSNRIPNKKKDEMTGLIIHEVMCLNDWLNRKHCSMITILKTVQNMQKFATIQLKTVAVEHFQYCFQLLE